MSAMRHRPLLLFVALTLLAAPVAAELEPTLEELADNRRRLGEWRKQPAQLQRLRREAQAFLELPEAQRDNVLRLDRELHALSPAAQARLHNVMVRYAAWLDKLNDKDRQRIHKAPD